MKLQREKTEGEYRDLIVMLSIKLMRILESEELTTSDILSILENLRLNVYLKTMDATKKELTEEQLKLIKDAAKRVQAAEEE